MHCSTCGAEIPAEGKYCSSCGAQVPTSAPAIHAAAPAPQPALSSAQHAPSAPADGSRGSILGCLGLLGLVGIIIVTFSMLFNQNCHESKPVPKSEEQLRKEKIESHFSRWDGSHNELTEYIKKSMNDPDSYKHVKTVYSDKGEYLIVQTTFRGTNAFGGVIANTVTAKVDLDGSILAVIPEGP